MKYWSMTRKANKAMTALDKAYLELQGDFKELFKEIKDFAHEVLARNKEGLTKNEIAAIYWASNEVKEIREKFFNKFMNFDKTGV